jgi:hypothetical protein
MAMLSSWRHPEQVSVTLCPWIFHFEAHPLMFHVNEHLWIYWMSYVEVHPWISLILMLKYYP